MSEHFEWPADVPAAERTLSHPRLKRTTEEIDVPDPDPVDVRADELRAKLESGRLTDDEKDEAIKILLSRGR